MIDNLYDLDKVPRCPTCDYILAHYDASLEHPAFFYCANLGCSNDNGYDEEMEVVVRAYPSDEFSKGNFSVHVEVIE